VDPIIREARNSELVPFVGAGASRALTDRATGRPLMPTWTEFLEQAAQDLPPDASLMCMQALKLHNLVEAATVIRNSISRPAWIRLLKRSFEVDRSSVNPDDLRLHREIWHTSRGIVITTNYDDALSWEVPSGMHSLRTFGLEAPVDLNGLLSYTPARPVLWHLHGRIRYPNTIVLASEGYESLYGVDTTVERRYRSALISLTVFATTRSLLFVGFSLNDSAILDVLRDMYVTFNDSDKSHYLICRRTEKSEIEARLNSATLDNVELIVVDNFGEPLIEALRDLRSPAVAAGIRTGAAAIRVGKAATLTHHPVYMRRRCRTVMAGSQEFITQVLPMLAEHRPSTAGQLLGDMALGLDPGFESAIIRSLMFEFQGRIELMLDAASSYTGEDELQNANCSLFRGIALEKLNRLNDAMGEYRQIISLLPPQHELRICASFNASVVREKLDESADEFAVLIDDREARLSSGELLWTKAFNMELIRCTRRGLRFRFEELLEAAISAEITEASTGFAKTLINWSQYSGKPLQQEFIDQVELTARRASITVRLPMLSYLQTVIADESLSKAIQDALDATGRNGTLLRLIDADDVQ
jgi:SIR2-like domain